MLSVDQFARPESILAPQWAAAFFALTAGDPGQRRVRGDSLTAAFP